jgi:hypothetical protein
VNRHLPPPPNLPLLVRKAEEANRRYSQALQSRYGEHADEMRGKHRAQTPFIQGLGLIYRDAIEACRAEWRKREPA